MEEYIGVIRMFAGTFVPENWSLCDGSVLAVASNRALFNVIGNTYGGDGVTTFALPDLRSRIPVGVADGSEPGGELVNLGQKAGEEKHVLVQTEMPTHTHPVYVSNVNATHQSASIGQSLAAFGNIVGTSFIPGNAYNNALPETVINGGTISVTGTSQGHENRQPFLAMNYIICVEGLYPPHS